MGSSGFGDRRGWVEVACGHGRAYNFFYFLIDLQGRVMALPAPKDNFSRAGDGVTRS